MNRLLRSFPVCCTVLGLWLLANTVQAQSITIQPITGNPQQALLTFSGGLSVTGTPPTSQTFRLFLQGAVNGATVSGTLCQNTVVATTSSGNRSLTTTSVAGTNLVLGFTGNLTSSATTSGSVLITLPSGASWATAASGTILWGAFTAAPSGTWTLGTATTTMIPDVSVTGLGVTITDGDASPDVADDTQFGEACVTGGVITKTFTIQNPSTNNLIISSVRTTNNTVFTVGGIGTNVTVTGGGSTTFTVSFDPATAGAVSAQVIVESNVCGSKQPYEFLVQGTGVTAPAAHTLSSQPPLGFCTGNAATLTLNGSSVGTDYTLLLNNTTTGTTLTGTGSSLSFPNITTAGTYSVRATVVAGGCSATMGSLNIQQLTPPTPPTLASGNACFGSNISFNGTSGTGLTHLWTVTSVSGTTSTSTAQNLPSTPVGTTAGNMTIQYVVTSSAGCSASASATISVSGATSMMPTIDPPAGNVCPASSITLTGTTPPSGATVVWSSSNAAVAVVTNAATGEFRTVNPGTSIIRYTITESSTCVSTGTATLTVQAGPVPLISNNTTSATAPLCVGSTLALTQTGGPGGGTWAITPPNPAVADVNPSTGVVSAAGAGTVTVTYTVSDGTCTGTGSTTVHVGDVTRPTVVCPTAPPARNADAGVCTATFTGLRLAPGSDDNCGRIGLTLTLFVVRANGQQSAQSSPGQLTDDILAGYPIEVGTSTVYYQLTDAAGNSNSCSINVTVRDNQAPVLTCPSTPVGPIIADASCEATVSGLLATATDNCGSAPTITHVKSAPTSTTGGADASGIFKAGSTTVTYTATDGLNTTTCAVVVVVTDNIPPTITCPFPTTVDTDPLNVIRDVDADRCTYTATGMSPTVPNDNCTPASSITVRFSMVSNPPTTSPITGNNTINGLALPIGQTMVTYTAADAAGNTATCMFNVNVRDRSVPSIVCPPMRTVDATLGTCATTIADLATPSYSDRCTTNSSALSLTYTTTGSTILSGTGTASGAFNLGSTYITYTVSDNNALSSTCSMTVVVLDRQPPTFTCPPNITLSTSSGVCTAVAGSLVEVNNLFDLCTAAYMSHIATGATTSNVTGSDAAALAFNKGITTVTYIARDEANNSSQCTFTVHVRDVEAPFLICPSDVTVAASNGCVGTTNALAMTLYTGTQTSAFYGDNCPSGLQLHYSLNGGVTWQPGNAPTTYNGSTTVTYRVTDEATYSETCSVRVTVADSAPPTLACATTPVTLNATTGACTAPYALPDPVTDNCTGATWSATFSNPVLAAQVATSSIGPINDGSASSPLLFSNGTTIVTFAATDGAGNAATATCTVAVIVRDNQPPTLTCITQPVSLLIPVGQCSVAVNNIAPVSFADNCANPALHVQMTGGTTTIQIPAGNPYGQIDDANGAEGWMFCIGTTTVRYTAVDEGGLTRTCTFQVVVRDETPPSFTQAGGVCPSPVTATTTLGRCDADVTNGLVAYATDNCTLNMKIRYTVTQGTTVLRDSTETNDGIDASGRFPRGVSLVTYTATDAAGLRATCTTTVTITDNEAPAITCPANVTLFTNQGVCNAVATGGAPVSVSDNCAFTLRYTRSDVPTQTLTALPSIGINGSTFGVGTTTVTYLVTENAPGTGSASCSFSVIVTDNQPPSITCPNPPTPTASAAANTCAAVVQGLSATMSDNCPNTLQLRHSIAPPTGVPTGFVAGSAGGQTFAVGRSIVSYEVVDASGNVSSCSFAVVVSDGQRPVITCPTPQTRTVDANDLAGCSASLTGLAATATDLCTTPMLTYTLAGATTLTTPVTPTASSIDASGSTFSRGTTTITYTATDGGGLTSVCSVSITVRSAQPTTVTCPSSRTLSAQANCRYVISATDNLEPSSACPGNLNYSYLLTGATQRTGTGSWSNAALASREIALGTTTVTYLVNDGAGGTFPCSFNLVVVDNTAPSVVCPANATVSASPTTCNAIVAASAIVPVSQTDNCGVQTISHTINGGAPITGTATATSPFAIGSNTIQYTVTDRAGLTGTCAFVLTIADRSAPSFTCPSSRTVSPSTGCVASENLAISPTDCSAPVTIAHTIAVGSSAPITGSGSLSSYSFPTGASVVTYVVSDNAGNTTTCTVNIMVRDNVGPTIANCPTSTVTVSTDATACSAASLGSTSIAVSATDNCSSASLSYSVTGPTGTFTNTGASSADAATGLTFPLAPSVRTIVYRATDASGNISTCSFQLVVRDQVSPTLANCPSNTLTFPSSSNCQAVHGITPPTATDNCGTPTLTTTLTQGSSTSAITTLPPSLASGSVITWTARDAAGNQAVCSTTVVVNDATAPVLTCATPIARNTTTNVCGYTVTATDLRPSATDNCGMSTLTYTLSAPPSTGSQTGNSAALTGVVLPTGTTVITWVGTDAAGNSSVCSSTVTVTDNQAPGIRCAPSSTQSGVLTSSCTFVPTTAIFEPVVSDACGLASTTYTMTGVTTGTGNLGGTLPTLNSGVTTINWISTDMNGRTATCVHTITVSSCTYVTGNIHYKTGPSTTAGTLGVNNVTVTMTGSSNGTTSTGTSNTGAYSFSVNGTGTYTLTPSKGGAWDNGVTSADALAIAAHIRTTNPVAIQGMCSVIAADVNMDRQITFEDQRIIVDALSGGSLTAVGIMQNKTWRFVPKTFMPTSIPSPTVSAPAFWTFPESATVTSTTTIPNVSASFWGIKKGDVVDFNANPFGQPNEGPAVALVVADRVVRAGELVRVPVSVRHFRNIAAYQCAFDFDTQHLQYVRTTQANVLSERITIGDRYAEAGELRAIWINSQGATVADESEVLYLEFRALQSGKRLSELVALNGDILPSKAYGADFRPQDLELRFVPMTNVPTVPDMTLQLFQNRPNPFREQTVIGFVLPQAGEARLRVLDLGGRLVWESNKTYSAGYQEETLQLNSELTAGGIYYYELTTPYGKAARKMILTNR